MRGFVMHVVGVFCLGVVLLTTGGWLWYTRDLLKSAILVFTCAGLVALGTSVWGILLLRGKRLAGGHTLVMFPGVGEVVVNLAEPSVGFRVLVFLGGVPNRLPGAVAVNVDERWHKTAILRTHRRGGRYWPASVTIPNDIGMVAEVRVVATIRGGSGIAVLQTYPMEVMVLGRA